MTAAIILELDICNHGIAQLKGGINIIEDALVLDHFNHQGTNLVLLDSLEITHILQKTMRMEKHPHSGYKLNAPG